MSNEEFDNLKEELMWEGSSVVMLSKRIFIKLLLQLTVENSETDAGAFHVCLERAEIICSCQFLISVHLFSPWLGPDEQKLLEASMAYVSGNPIMTDEEFDQLKLRLKVCSCYPVNLLLLR